MIAICGFFCGRGILLMVPMGAMGPFWPGDSSSRAVGGGGLAGCVQSREFGACAPRLPRFILLVNFSDTLLVVSILEILDSPEGIKYLKFITFGEMLVIAYFNLAFSLLLNVQLLII